MNTVKKVVSFLLRTILRPITDALVIKAIEKGEVSEREIVEKAKRKLIRSLDEELPKCVDYDEEAAKGAAILKKQAMAAKTIDDMLKIRQEKVEKVNEMFGTNISVDFASSWKQNVEEMEAELEALENPMQSSQLNNDGGKDDGAEEKKED